MNSLLIREGGQSALEQALLISVIALGLLSGGLYISRSMKAKLKMVENQVNEGVKVVSPTYTYTYDYDELRYACYNAAGCGSLDGQNQSTCFGLCALALNEALACMQSHCGYIPAEEEPAPCRDICEAMPAAYGSCIFQCHNEDESTYLACTDQCKREE